MFVVNTWAKSEKRHKIREKESQQFVDVRTLVIISIDIHAEEGLHCFQSIRTGCCNDVSNDSLMSSPPSQSIPSGALSNQQHPQHQQMSHLLTSPTTSPSLSSPMPVNVGGAHSPMPIMTSIGSMETLIMPSHCLGDEHLDQQNQFHHQHHQQSLHHHHPQHLHSFLQHSQPQESFEPLEHLDWTSGSPPFSVGSFIHNFMTNSTPTTSVGGNLSHLPQQTIVSSTAGPSPIGESTFLVLNPNGHNTFISGQPETTLDGNNVNIMSHAVDENNTNATTNVDGNMPEPLQIVSPGQCMIYS